MTFRMRVGVPTFHPDYWCVASAAYDFPETGKYAELSHCPLRNPDGSPTSDSDLTTLEVREGDVVSFVGREWRVTEIQIGPPPPPGTLGLPTSHVVLEPLGDAASPEHG